MKNKNEEKYIDLLCKGIELKRNGQYEEAKEKYIKAIRLNSKNPNAYYNLGKILYILEEYDESVRSLKVAFELGIDPTNVLIHIGHALNDIKYKESSWKDVIEFYERGVNPFSLKKLFKKGVFKIENPDMERVKEYDKFCIETAKEFLNL